MGTQRLFAWPTSLRLGVDHTKLTYRHAGRDFRLTDVEGEGEGEGEVVRDILA